MTIDRHAATAHVGLDALKVERWSVTIDETWSPFVQATLLVAADAVSRALNPRDEDPPRVTLVLEQRYGIYGFLDDFDADFDALTLDQIDAVVVNGDGDTVADLTLDELDLLPCISYNSVQIDATRFEADLHVRRRRLRRDGLIELTLASDEGILSDARSTAIWNDLTLVDLVSSLLASLSAFPWPYTLGTITDEGFNPTLPVGQDPTAPTIPTLDVDYDDYFTFLNKVSDTVNARVWCDEARAWHAAEFPLPTVGDTLTVGVADRMTDFDDDINRDEWNDYPIGRWRWTDDDGVGHEYVLAPLGAFGRSRVGFFDHSFRPAFAESDGTTAFDAVSGIGARARARARDTRVTARPDYTAYAGRPVEITLPDEPVLSGAIRAVTFRGPDAPLMEITTRDIEES